ncbi:recombinase family protein [Marinobacterium marinum]|uniref:Recombinase family protein n=1 Tax=Marinobacterium marinum TaxID=2756129 RepID=A0A7W1WX70_9GAMM|nr:recombinase family protein [Marinobacterium marinum]MBA4501841.1 recombinase family protein [Marinobacterium marinum]
MFIRAYLRASTKDQDANRARSDLEQFASDHGHKVASYYTENESGTRKDRPELMRLLDDAHAGDVLLVEQVDRLSRLSADDWKTLRHEIDSKGVRVVALDLPTSHAAMKETAGDDFTARMLDALNGMMLDVLAAVARKDYDDRRRRQRQGIDKAKAAGVYQGRKKDADKRLRVAELLEKGHSVRRTAELAGCSTYLVQTVKREKAAT